MSKITSPMHQSILLPPLVKVSQQIALSSRFWIFTNVSRPAVHCADDYQGPQDTLVLFNGSILTYILEEIGWTKDIKKNDYFFGLGKYHPTLDTSIRGFVIVHKYFQKKIPFQNRSLPRHMLEITPEKPQEIVAPKDESLRVPTFWVVSRYLQMRRDWWYVESTSSKDPKIPWRYLVVQFWHMSWERLDGLMHRLMILKEKKKFGLGKYHSTPNTYIRSLVKVQKYFQKRSLFQIDPCLDICQKLLPRNPKEL